MFWRTYWEISLIPIRRFTTSRGTSAPAKVGDTATTKGRLCRRVDVDHTNLSIGDYVADSNVFLSGKVVPKRRSTLFDQAVSIPEPSQVRPASEGIGGGCRSLSTPLLLTSVIHLMRAGLRVSNTEVVHCCLIF
jgi:hypothetical protein